MFKTILIFCLAFSAMAAPGFNERPIRNANQALGQIAAEVAALDESDREELRGKLRGLRDLVNDLKSKVKSIRPPSGSNGWYQAAGDNCSSLCSLVGKSSATSPDGAVCASGETIVQSAINNLQFTLGCWPQCGAQNNITTFTSSIFCYKPGQKKDGDFTDVTVGCFCN